MKLLQGENLTDWRIELRNLINNLTGWCGYFALADTPSGFEGDFVRVYGNRGNYVKLD